MTYSTIYNGPTAAEVKEHNDRIYEKINSLNAQIEKLIELHDSLASFKSSIQIYYEKFNTASSEKIKKISNLKANLTDNEMAKTYVGEMPERFENVATLKLEYNLWIPFGELIDKKLNYYIKEIERLRDEINRERNNLW